MKVARSLWIGVLTGLVWLLSPSSSADLGPRAARASVSVALTMQELVDGSQRAVEAVALERRSIWEQEAGGRRIVTYTKVRVVTAMYGPRAATLQIRTLGGAVGKIGQQVSGEAQLAVGERCLLFLTPVGADAHAVVGRAQGHYPIVADEDGTRRLRASPDRGRVLPRRGPSISAYAQLVGKRSHVAFEAVRSARHKRDGQQ